MSNSLISKLLTNLKNENSLKNKTALVTGASAGIGLATSVYLANEGVNLILTARREERLSQLKKELEQAYPNIQVQIIPADLTQKNIISTFENADAFNVDIFINNAGLARGRDAAHALLETDIDEMIDTNLKACFKLSAKVAAKMVQKGSGHIVHLGSVAGKCTYEGGSVYCATKFALRAFSQTMRQELYDKNVRVTLIAPGMVKTEFSLTRFKGNKELADKVYADLECLQADDIARNILTALKEPSHVNLDEVVILPTIQSPVTYKIKGR